LRLQAVGQQRRKAAVVKGFDIDGAQLDEPVECFGADVLEVYAVGQSPLTPCTLSPVR
jgi:hypothetical protein